MILPCRGYGIHVQKVYAASAVISVMTGMCHPNGSESRGSLVDFRETIEIYLNVLEHAGFLKPHVLVTNIVDHM